VGHPVARTYLSLGAFYASDPQRRRSRERDVGLWWRSRRGPTYRAAWVQDTGEIYLFQHVDVNAPSRADGLANAGGGSVHLLAATMDGEELDRRLEGWRDVCGKPNSLEWLLERACPPPVDAGPGTGARFDAA
jgi:hypothetical protein